MLPCDITALCHGSVRRSSRSDVKDLTLCDIAVLRYSALVCPSWLPCICLPRTQPLKRAFYIGYLVHDIYDIIEHQNCSPLKTLQCSTPHDSFQV